MKRLAEACRTTWYRSMCGDGEAADEEREKVDRKAAAGTGEARGRKCQRRSAVLRRSSPGCGVRYWV
ncbi:hypothetical protein [Paenibacillus larvae]|uniref:hypothetical protein n=1 Tax=Paenibacillus larvae TaxID=1464 RepID=UPI00288E9DC0|nr:hypothetical protein [Paenibacillus larvae]MDT2194481.1 hypothetical protein [Paenibacillus larvae]